MDFLVSNHGSVWQFTPVSDAAKEFAKDRLGLEVWQWMGNSFCIDHRPAASLVETLNEEGWCLGVG